LLPFVEKFTRNEMTQYLDGDEFGKKSNADRSAIPCMKLYQL